MKLKINPKHWGITLAIKDIIGYSKFISTIKKEKNNPNSKFNKFNIKHNAFYTLYTIISLEDSDHVLDERMKRVRVIDTLKPVHSYLDDELGFAGSLTPEFSQFYNEKNEPTLSYAAIYRYVFEKLSILWVIKWSIIITILTWLIIHYKDFIINLLK